MRVALITTFATSRKESLVAMVDRVHQGFVDSGRPEPFIRFTFGDGLPVMTSIVDRLLKRYPELARFVTEKAPIPGMPGIQGARRISNGAVSPGANEAVPYTTLRAIAAGVPRSFPFHSVGIHFYSQEFGELMPTPTFAAGMMAGVLISDSWWVNGRQRSLSACRVAEVGPEEKKLPGPSGPVATIFASCGKARKTVQAPVPAVLGKDPVPAVRLSTGVNVASANPEAARAANQVAVKYRERLPEILKQVNFPHELPSPGEIAPGLHPGPKRPALERVFKPMGYSVRGGTGGETGSFSMRRRTAANSTLELSLDCGTWMHGVLAIFKIWGLGFKATLTIPPGANVGIGAQYRIGDAEHWREAVENLGVMVAELERTFVPEVEAAAGPSPEWYQPES
jgi:hypothetical protein